MRIERLTQQNLARCAGVLRQPFAVIGRLLPEYRDGRWSAQEELFPEPREKVYPDDVACARFLEEEACAGFAALEGSSCSRRTGTAMPSSTSSPWTGNGAAGVSVRA